MIPPAIGPFLIQDADDYAGGALASSDVGKFMAVVDRNGRLSFALVDAPETTILQNGMAQVRAIASRIQDAPDGPGKPGAGDNGKALAWNNSTGRFVMAGGSGNGLDADTLDGHDTGYFLAADGTRTGATSQAQTFTNGIVSPSWKPASDSTTALQMQNASGTSLFTIDTTNNRFGFNSPTPSGEFEVIAPNTGAITIMTNNTNNTNKTGRLVIPNYDTSQRSLLVFGGSTTSAGNTLFFGGSSSVFNAATLIVFYTGIDNNTATGTEKMRITNTGLVGVNTTPTNTFQVGGSATGVGTVATNGTTTLTGTNTVFANMFKAGDTITVSGETARTILTIASDTSLTVDTAFSTTASGLSYTKTAVNAFAVRSNGNVGIGTTAPASKLVINGNSSKAAWGTAGIGIQLVAATYTDVSTAASGTVANTVINSIGLPTLAAFNTSVTATNVANWYINNAPAAGTNVTITNSYALWVDDGNVRFDGNLLIGGTGTPTAALHLPASTTSVASLRIPHGSAPSSPNDGDMWSTTAGLFIRINGVTKTVTLT